MDLRANAIITAVDRFSGPVARMSGALNALTRGSQAAAAGARRAGHAFSGSHGIGSMVASGAFLKSQLDFERSLNRTQAILDETSIKKFRPLRDEMINLAKAYPAMRSEIAAGASELAMSGMKLDTVRAVLGDAVRGAMASGESIKTVGEGVTDVIYSMGLPFKTAAEQTKSFAQVNDVMAAAATSANDTYTGFLTSIGRAGPVARMAGVDLTALAAAHGVLANAGIKAERAGISLRSMMVRALAPTKKARELMRAQGVDWNKWMNSTGKKLTTQGLFGMLEEGGVSTTGLSDTVRAKLDALMSDPNMTRNLGVLGDKVTEIIAGGLDVSGADIEDRAQLSDTVRRYLSSTAANLDFQALFKELAEKKVTLPLLKELLSLRHVEKAGALVEAFQAGLFDEMLATIERKAPGATDRMSKIMMQGFVGAFYRMKSAIDAFGDTLANTGVMDTMTGVFDKIREGVDAIGQSNPKILELGTYAVLISGAMGIISFAFSGLVGPVGALAGALAAAPIAGTLTAIAAAITALALASEKYDPDKGILGSVPDAINENRDSVTGWWDWLNEKTRAMPTIPELMWGKDATNIWGENLREQRLRRSRPISSGVYGDSLPPLAGTTDALIRSLVPTAGPQTVDVTGKVTAEGKVSGRIDVDVRITGHSDVSGYVESKRGGEIQGELKTGKSMPDTSGP